MGIIDTIKNKISTNSEGESRIPGYVGMVANFSWGAVQHYYPVAGIGLKLGTSTTFGALAQASNGISKRDENLGKPMQKSGFKLLGRNWIG